MIRSQIRKDVTRRAFERGYRVTEDGFVIGTRGYKLVTIPTTDGFYPKFSVRDPFVGRTVLVVHLLAGYQWFGESMFEEGIEVRHLNGNGFDNRKENLVLGTHSQNMMDKPKEVRQLQAETAAKARRRLTEEQCRQLRIDRASGYKYVDLCMKYKITKSLVSYIVNKKTYKQV